jgi:hypothetical protein
MNSIGTTTVKNELANSIVGLPPDGKLPKPASEYRFKVIEVGCNGDLLCLVTDHGHDIAIADVSTKDIDVYTPHPPIVPNTDMSGVAEFLAMVGDKHGPG